MAAPAIGAARLLARGVALPGVDGEEVRLRFSLLAIARCEERYGSLALTLGELQELVEARSGGFLTPVADRTAALVAAVVGAPEPVDVMASPGEVIDALMDAWVEAFPPPDETSGKAEGATAPSHGSSGGGSPE